MFYTEQKVIRLVLKDEPPEMIPYVLANEIGGQVPDWIQLMPSGLVHSTKGDFTVDQEGMQDIKNLFASRGNDIVIDYEHQTLDGGEAPAAGWIKELQDRQDGLWAKVDWTERAKGYLANKEYRYLSPVVMVRKADNKAVALHSVGLTNTPAMSGVRPIVNKQQIKEEQSMKFLEELATTLGVGQAEEAAVLAAAKALKDQGQLPAHKEVLSLLDLKDGASLADIKGKIIALSNPTGYVKAEEFRSLQDKLAARDRDELVSRAMTEGKITPAQKTWAEQYALKDQEGFKAFIEQAPQVVPLGSTGASGGRDRQKTDVPDEQQMVVNKMLGISDEDFKKYGQQDTEV